MRETRAGVLAILPLTAVAVVTGVGLAGLTTNAGPQPDSAPTRPSIASPNVTTALAMMAGRFGSTIPALALAGLFAQRQRKPATDGSLPTDTPLFAGLVIGTLLAVGGLSYLPVLALGGSSSTWPGGTGLRAAGCGRADAQAARRSRARRRSLMAS